MRLPFFIANRYLLAKKSHNLINIITWISIVSISVASFALIVVLSAFNGLEKVVSEMSNRLAPDLQIAAVKGKTIDLSAFPMEALRAVPSVEHVVPTLTEDALFRANDKQHIGQVKGVGEEYEQVERLQSVMLNGDDMTLSSGDYGFAIPGVGVVWYLGINPNDPYAMLRIYVPKRGDASSMSLENGFNSDVLNIRGIFSTEQEVDQQMVLVPLAWLSSLLEYQTTPTPGIAKP